MRQWRLQFRAASISRRVDGKLKYVERLKKEVWPRL
jgi:hypothetical protein